MNIICFCIPARYESTRLPKKLLLKIDKLSCIQQTVTNVSKSKYFNNNIFVLTDDIIIQEHLNEFPCQVLLTSKDCINGSERISKHINLLPENYKYIINVQGDEPFVSEKNIDYAIEKHLENNNEQLFYTTLHEETNSDEYLKSCASIKLISDLNNNVLYYSRNIIPWNKNNEIKKDFVYKTFTGIYVFNREKIELFHTMHNTPLQMHEDCEQLKILEHGYKIKTYPTIDYNEISLNTYEDYKYLLNKYSKNIDNLLENKNESNQNEKIKLVCFDLDGVFTDGKIYVDEHKHTKCYNGKDSYGLKLLKDKNIKIGLITSHDTPLLKNMEHIFSRMDYVSSGNYNKKEILDQWKEKLDLEYNQIAYIGDDLPDKEILEIVGFSACPNDAHDSIKNIVKFISIKNGGNGAVREFVDYIIENLL